MAADRGLDVAENSGTDMDCDEKALQGAKEVVPGEFGREKLRWGKEGYQDSHFGEVGGR